MDFYRTFAKASSVRLIRISYRYLVPLFVIFPHIRRFTLSHIDMPIIYPPFSHSHITHLSLIHVKMVDHLFLKWMELLRDHLKGLHIDQVATYYRKGTTRLPRMSYLDVQARELNASDIIQRDIRRREMRSYHETPSTIKTGVSQCTKLEQLYLNVAAPTDPDSLADYFYAMDDLRSLTTKTWLPIVMYPAALTHLKVIEAVDVKFQPAIEALCLPSLDVNFYSYAAEENLILNTLHNDCLIRLLQYLPLADCVAFSKTHSRIRQLATRYRFPTLRIENDSKNVVKENPQFFQQAAPFIRILSVYNAEEQLWLLPYCISLKSLVLSWVTMTNAVLEGLPQSLQGLILYNCSGQRERIAPSAAKSLPQLKELSTDSRVDVETVQELLALCGSSLQHFRIRLVTGGDVQRFNGIWETLATIETFQWLTFHRSVFNSDGRDTELMQHLYQVLGKKLRRLTVDVQNNELAEFINAETLERLEELQVSSASKGWLKGVDMRALCSLKGLSKMRIGSWGSTVPKVTEAQMMQLVDSLPQLSQLEMPSLKPSNVFSVELKRHLDKERRRVRVFTNAVAEG